MSGSYYGHNGEYGRDPVIQSLHRLFKKIYTPESPEDTDPYFAELKERNNNRIRRQDFLQAPVVLEISSNPDVILNAIHTFRGFFLSKDGESITQRIEKPKTALMIRDLPTNYTANDIYDLCRNTSLADGSPCPLPNPEKSRFDTNTWVVVFSSEEEAKKASSAMKSVVVEGKTLGVSLKNEHARVHQYGYNGPSLRTDMPNMMYAANMGNLSPQFGAPMYAQSPYFPPNGTFPAYFAYPQPYIQFPMPPGNYMAHPQYAAHPQAMGYGFDPSVMAAGGMYAPQGPMPGGNNYYNNNNKPRRNQSFNGPGGNGGRGSRNRDQVPGRYYQQRGSSDQLQQQDGQQGSGLPSPTAFGTGSIEDIHGSTACLESQPSVAPSFSHDEVDELNASAAPVISVPVATTATAEVVVVEDETSEPVVEPTEGEADTTANGSATVEKPARNFNNNRRERGENRGNRDGKRDSARSYNGENGNIKNGDRRNNTNGNRSGSRATESKDGAAAAASAAKSKERKTPPVSLNLEKDFPTLHIASTESAKETSTSSVKSSTPNYANALKKPNSVSDFKALPTSSAPPKASVPATTAGVAPPAAPIASPAVPAAVSATHEVPHVPVAAPTAPKAEVSSPAPVATAAAVLPKSAPVAAPAPAPTSETVVPAKVAEVPAAASDEAVSNANGGGRKTFIDALRAKK